MEYSYWNINIDKRSLAEIRARYKKKPTKLELAMASVIVTLAVVLTVSVLIVVFG